MPYNSKYTGATAEAVLNSIPGKVGEAPKDSANYARNNGAWVKLNKSLLATVVGPRQMIAQNGSGEQAYTFSFDQPAASITLKSLSISGPGVSLKAGYSKSGFTVVATDIVGDITAIVTAVFTFGSVDYTIDAPIIVSYQFYVNNNGYDYVDLGLPSGTLWATCNVGASAPDGQGLFFMWGETKGNDCSNGTTNGRSYSESTYNNLGLNAISGDLDLEHDAAHAHMGGEWHMPSLVNAIELRDYCTCENVEYNGVVGKKFTSIFNRESIFIPSRGACMDSQLATSLSMSAWLSSTRGSSEAWYILQSGFELGIRLNYIGKWYGAQVRAVI